MITLSALRRALACDRSSCSCHKPTSNTHCPAHDDKNTSLSVTERDGKVLVKCHAGCDQSRVIESLKDMNLWHVRHEEKNVQAKTGGTQSGMNVSRTLVSAYVYTDETGNLLFQCLRFDPKDFRQRRKQGGDWVWNLEGVRLVPYRLPELVSDVASGKMIFVVEGEKDVDHLRSMGFSATTNPMGAGKWRDEYATYLLGADVVLIPDNDPPSNPVGQRHMEAVARSISSTAASVRMLHLPGLPPKGDVSDWLDAGGTGEELKRMATAAPVWTSAAAQLPCDEQAWDPLIPFTANNLPAFPTTALPAWLRKYVEAEAEATQTPSGMAAMMALAVVATTIQKKAKVRCRTHSEPTNLWTAIVMPPGSRKSAVVADMIRPLRDYERERNKELQPAIERAESDMKIVLAQINQTEKKLATSEDAANRQVLETERNILIEKRQELRVVHPCRLVADDCTPERLVTLLAEHDERMSILSAEGGVFSIMGGRYSDKGPNLDIYLMAQAGDAYTTDRVGRGSVTLDEPALTIGVTIQPDVLQSLGKEREFRGRGALGRFLYCIPPDNVGYRKTGRHVNTMPSHVQEAYRTFIRRLLDLTPAETIDGEEHPHYLCLSTEAEDVYETFAADIERRQREDGDLCNLTDWASKLHGATLRIAGILHVAEHAGEPDALGMDIELDTMENAVAIARFLLEHAKAAYRELGMDPKARYALSLLKWVRGKVAIEEMSFTRSEVTRALEGSLKADEIDAGLDILTERGFVREAVTAPREATPTNPHRGGRRATVYDINPSTKESILSKETPSKAHSLDRFDSFPGKHGQNGATRHVTATF